MSTRLDYPKESSLVTNLSKYDMCHGNKKKGKMSIYP